MYYINVSRLSITGVRWTELAQDKVQWHVFVMMVVLKGEGCLE
jgi:hypothetical protein